MDKKLQDILTEQQVLQDETKAKLEREILELRAKLSRVVEQCALLVKTQAHHPKDCRCLNCRDLHAIKQQILALKV